MRPTDRPGPALRNAGFVRKANGSYTVPPSSAGHTEDPRLTDSSRSVLVVDDDADVRALLKDLLSEEGYTNLEVYINELATTPQ